MTMLTVADAALETEYLDAIARGVVRPLSAEEYADLMTNMPDLDWPDYTDAELSAFASQSLAANSALYWES